MLIDGINLVEGSVNSNIVITNKTQAQREALTNLDVGEIVYQSDGAKGLYVYHGAAAGWVQADSVSAADLTEGTLAAARLPAFTGGDVTASAGSTALVLATSGVTAGTYNSVTVDAKGRVTSASNETYGSTSASDLTSGTLAAARLPAFTGGDVTASAGSTSLVLGTTGVTAGTYNSVTVDAKGRVTAASNVSSGSTNASDLTSGTLAAARLPAFTGDATTTAGTSALTLSTTGVTAGTYNSVTVDAKGRVTAATNVTLPTLVANTFTGNQTAPVFISNVATGTAPFTVTSTTAVANLNVQVVNGITISGTPTTGQVLTATSATAASWAAASGGGGSATGDTSATPNTIAQRTADGSLYATNFYSTSSRELKENITAIEGVNVLALEPVSFTFKADEEHKLHYGFIAEEVEQVAPALISVSDAGTKSVNYVEIVPLLLAEIQKLTARIEALEAK